LIHDNNTAYHIMTNRPPRNLFGREKQSRVVFTKPFFPRSYTPPVNNPWRMYGKKLNSDPVIISDQ